MQWYEALTDDISMKDIYSHKELIGKLKNLKAGLPDGTYNWILSSLVREGQFFRQGYDAYCLPGGITKAEYRPDYSQDAQRVMNERDFYCSLGYEEVGRYRSEEDDFEESFFLKRI